jgi:hypothetical protein
MSEAIEVYTSFYQEKGQPAVCGIVLSRGGIKRPFFKHRPSGDYLNGLFELLTDCIKQMVPRLNDSVLHLDIHIHHKNSNFKKALDKVRTAAETARGYEGLVRGNVIKHTLTRKDHHKPASYDKMSELAFLLAETNSPVHRITIATCGDSRSPDQLAVYTACQGFWNDIRAADALTAPAAVGAGPAN